MAGFLKNKHHPTDPTWHVQVAMLIAIVLQLALPDKFLVAPRYFIPGIEVLLLLALSFTTPRERIFKSLARRVNAILLIAVSSLANGYALVTVVNQLLKGNEAATDGRALILAAIN